MIKKFINKIRHFVFAKCSFSRWIVYFLVGLLLAFSLVIADLQNRVFLLEIDMLFLYDSIEVLIEELRLPDREFAPDCPNPELDNFDDLNDGEYWM